MNIMYIPSLVSFFLVYLISFILVISCNDWFLLWFGLEINMICYIMLVYKRYNLWNLESCYKYFLVQSMSSAVFLMILFMGILNLEVLILMLLSLKMGAGPFFFWFISVVKGFDWISIYLLSTIQKFIPMLIMMVFINSFLWSIALISLIIGMVGSFNQTNVSELMGYSSVHHLGWMLICLMVDDLYWVMYLLMYSLLMMSIIYVLINEEIVMLSVINKIKGKWWFVMGMLSMGGMPPLLGFILKMITLYYFMMVDMFYVSLLLMMSVIMFYVYIRLLYMVIMNYHHEMMWKWSIGDKNYYQYDIINMGGMMLMLLIGLLMLFDNKMMFC